mgnify:FL=1
MKNINFFPRTKSEAMEIANEYIASKDGLAYDMDMSVDEAKANAEIVCKNLTLTVNCDGESPLKLYYKYED